MSKLDTVVETLFGRRAEPKQERFRGNVHAVPNGAPMCKCFVGEILKVGVLGIVYDAESRWMTASYRAGLEGKSWKEVIGGVRDQEILDSLFEQYAEGMAEAKLIRWEA